MIDTERAVLGAMILDPAIIPEVMQHVSGGQFSTRLHTLIFEIICEAGERVGLSLIHARLVEHGYHELPYLVTLEQYVLSVGGAPELAAIVAKHARLREFAIISAKIQEAAARYDFASCLEFSRSFPTLRESGMAAPESLAAIMAQKLPPIEWIIPQILAVGSTLLVAPPKIGKSLLALQSSVAVACGGYAFGSKDFKCPQGEVLYISLDDRSRHTLQDRIRTMRTAGDINEDDLYWTEEWPDTESGGLDLLAHWIDTHPKARLIVVDTLEKFRGQNRKFRDENAYIRDVKSMEPIANLAIRKGIALLLIHHTNKSGAPDPLQQVSGSQGVTGGASCIIMLERERGSGTGRLRVTPRASPEKDFSVAFDGSSANMWTVQGDFEALAKAGTQESVLACLRSGPRKIKDITDATGLSTSIVRGALRSMNRDGIACLNGAPGVWHLTPEKRGEPQDVF